MHCNRRGLLRRGLEFLVWTINKSAHSKKPGNLSYAPRINTDKYIDIHIQLARARERERESSMLNQKENAVFMNFLYWKFFWLFFSKKTWEILSGLTLRCLRINPELVSPRTFQFSMTRENIKFTNITFAYRPKSIRGMSILINNIYIYIHIYYSVQINHSRE